jgi:hypothetical protein
VPDRVGHAFSVCCEAAPESLSLTILIDVFPLPATIHLVEEIPMHAFLIPPFLRVQNASGSVDLL